MPRIFQRQRATGRDDEKERWLEADAEGTKREEERKEGTFPAMNCGCAFAFAHKGGGGGLDAAAFLCPCRERERERESEPDRGLGEQEQH